jgi:poly(hydroxyalkanoate) depolymerase family esterase
MNSPLQDLMREATRLTRIGRLHEATDAIQKALNGKPDSTAAMPEAPQATHRAAGNASASLVLDGCITEIRTNRNSTASADADAHAVQAIGKVAEDARPFDRFVDQPSVNRPDTRDSISLGRFVAGVHMHAGQSFHYKLYSPPARVGQSLPLVVMLHGCKQNPDDFAAGTGMNERAGEQGFFVLYPAQSQGANVSRCWNWFKRKHQQRDSGEPAMIADLTRTVIGKHNIDQRRVYIAGLSAGGAMAAIVAGEYPEIFAAVGVHSGLPCGAAIDVSGALAVMQSGIAQPGRTGVARKPVRSVPTIVFHGDQDRTVHPRNGEQLIAAVTVSADVASNPASNTNSGKAPRVEQGLSAHGRRYTRSIHRQEGSHAAAEHWLIHGAGHAWSGGDAKSTYTDAKGPDATSEMLRFFFEHPAQ